MHCTVGMSGHTYINQSVANNISGLSVFQSKLYLETLARKQQWTLVVRTQKLT
uniref:Uncharacterized protein n=1 Tax=Nelumbo nucifera TaxID=4432 RepID=A0A822Y864_NELNU|nr:TPA_asm: hypothetical protein HUJ06_029931 [Nelumbo nucifera]